MSWNRGIAFVRGINIYGSKRISKRKMLELCKRIEDENLRIIKIVRCDNIVFEKKKIHYATVSSRLEASFQLFQGKCLCHFKKHEND